MTDFRCSRRQIWMLASCLLFGAYISLVSAQDDRGQSDTETAAQYAKGMASAPVKGRWLKKACKGDAAQDNEDYAAVVNDAKVNALRAWAAQKSKAFSDLFGRAEAEMVADLDRYLLNPLVKQRCKKDVLQVSVTAQVNEAAVSQLMASKRSDVQGPRSRMTAVFFARRQASVQSYDAKVTKISEQKEFSEVDQAADIAGASMSASGMSSTRTVNTTGGSTQLKADKIEYALFQADGLDASVNETFASSGYRAIDASQVAGRFPGFDLNALRAEFAAGDELSPETKNAAFNAIAGKIPLFVIATVDILIGRTSRISEDQVESWAQVKATVYQDDGLFYETVASVGLTQRKGQGPSETVAETNALIEASRFASEEIINQLYAQGVY